MVFFTKDFKQIFPTQIISITGGLLAGSLLAIALDKIYLIPGFFIIVPGLLDMRGSISGSLAARLSAGLHLGVIKPNKIVNRVAIGNAKAAFLQTIIISLLIGLIAYVMTYFLFNSNYPKLILISLLASVIANTIEVPMTILLTFWLFKRGFDPNNIMGPYVSTSGDIITILSLLIVTAVI